MSQLMTRHQQAILYNCTPEQIKKQYRANLEGLQRMLKRAEDTGKRVNGYTEDELSRLVEKYTRLVNN